MHAMRNECFRLRTFFLTLWLVVAVQKLVDAPLAAKWKKVRMSAPVIKKFVLRFCDPHLMEVPLCSVPSSLVTRSCAVRMPSTQRTSSSTLSASAG